MELGTLILNGDNTNFEGSVTIGTGAGEAVLQSSTASLKFASPTDTSILVNENGILRFEQLEPLTTITLEHSTSSIEYEGTINGAGRVEKVGFGSLVLNLGQSYSGGTWIKEGEIAIRSNTEHSDSALGAPNSKIILGDETTSGTLTFLDTVYINENRDIELKKGGGTLYTRGILENDEETQASIVNSSLPGGLQYLGASASIYSVISGEGNLTKKGKGGLIFYNENTYTGDTYIEEGILMIHKGFASPNVYISDPSKLNSKMDKGEIAFYTEGFVYDGKISGAGRISVQEGDVTLTNYNDFHGLVDVYGTMILSDPDAYISAETWFNVAVLEGDDPNEAPQVGKLYIQGNQLLPVIKLYEDAVFILEGELHVNHNNMDGYGLDANFHEDSYFVGDGSMYFESGRTILERSSYAFSGTSQVSDGAFLQMKSIDRSAILNGTTIIDAGGTVEGNGRLGIIKNHGNISPGFGSVSSDDVVTGTISAYDGYEAYDGATLTIHAVLGGDDSLTDKLHILSGGTEGHTLVKVENYTGQGAKTNEGILVVQVDGGNANGTFELSSNYIDPISGFKSVLGGAYAYFLEQDGDNWYMRSSFLPFIPVYEVYPQLLLSVNNLATLQQRVGNRMWISDENMSYMEKAGQWVKFDSSLGYFQSKLTTHANYNLNTFKVQSGMDRPLFKFDGGSWLIGGASAFYSKGKSEVAAAMELGNINTDSLGLAASVTLYEPKGFYMDIQGQATLFLSDVVASSNDVDYADIENNRGFGTAASIEIGKRFDLNTNWSLTPQIQLTSSNVNFEDFEDDLGQTIFLLDGKSLIGRLSLAVNYEKSWVKNAINADHLKVYGILNLYNEFLDRRVVLFVDGEEVISEQEKLWGGVGIGATYSLNDGFTSVYGEFGAKTSLKNFGKNRVYTGIVGLRIKF